MATINITKDSPSNINISGVWTWHDYYTVSYSWSGAPEGISLPANITKLKSGDVVSVDSSYSNTSEVDKDDFYYTFSGWDKSGNITVNSNVIITGTWTSHNYLSVSYNWTNAPSGVSLPSSVTKLKSGASVAVNTTYTSSSTVDGDSKYYTFSGWNKSGNITVTGDTIITGAWTAHNYYTVSYSWSGAPSSLKSTVPSTITKLKSGDIVSVNSTYSNKTAKKDVDITWTEGTISNTSRSWHSVCYGNDKYVAVGYNSNTFAYSTDGINWTEGTISSTSRNWWSVCYGNGKYVTVVNGSNYFAYSTDGITWTESTISDTNRQ